MSVTEVSVISLRWCEHLPKNYSIPNLHDVWWVPELHLSVPLHKTLEARHSAQVSEWSKSQTLKRPKSELRSDSDVLITVTDLGHLNCPNIAFRVYGHASSLVCLYLGTLVLWLVNVNVCVLTRSQLCKKKNHKRQPGGGTRGKVRGFHNNPSRGCSDLSVWTKVLDWKWYSWTNEVRLYHSVSCQQCRLGVSITARWVVYLPLNT